MKNAENISFQNVFAKILATVYTLVFVDVYCVLQSYFFACKAIGIVS